jgi:hypothetical protein
MGFKAGISCNLITNTLILSIDLTVREITSSSGGKNGGKQQRQHQGENIPTQQPIHIIHIVTTARILRISGDVVEECGRSHNRAPRSQARELSSILFSLLLPLAHQINLDPLANLII